MLHSEITESSRSAPKQIHFHQAAGECSFSGNFNVSVRFEGSSRSKSMDCGPRKNDYAGLSGVHKRGQDFINELVVQNDDVPCQETAPSRNSLEDANSSCETRNGIQFYENAWYNFESNSHSKWVKTKALSHSKPIVEKHPRSWLPKDISPSGISRLDRTNSWWDVGCHVQLETSETVASQQNRDHNLRCNLPYNGHGEDRIHYERCFIVIMGHACREEYDSWLKSIPSADESITRLFKSTDASNDCVHSDEGNANLNFTGHQDFEICVKWFLTNAQSNYRFLLQLLYYLSRYRGENLLLLVFGFSTGILKLPKYWRKRVGSKLIEILVNGANVSEAEAVRGLLIFNVVPTMEASVINELLWSLNVFDVGFKDLYYAVSCVWHISNKLEFPVEILMNMAKECLVAMPADLKLTKDAILDGMIKCSRRDLLKHYRVLESFLNKYYPLNSKKSHFVRTSVFYNVVPDTCVGRYPSRRVKCPGTVNRQWNYWDVNENQRKSFSAVVDKHNATGYGCVQLNSRSPPDESLVFESLSNDCILVKRNDEFDQEDAIEQITSAINDESYSSIADMIGCQEHDSADDFFHIFHYILCNLEEDQMYVLINEVVTDLRERKSPAADAFLRTTNSLAMSFYENQNPEITVKILKTVRSCGVDPFQYSPKTVDKKVFFVMAADSHFSCRCFKEAIEILKYGECFELTVLNEHFAHVERLVVEMMKVLLKERLALYAFLLFREVVIAQRDLHYPIDVSVFYEGVILVAFVPALKFPCTLHQGANLFVLVDRICGNDVIFGSTTYSCLLVHLHNANAPEDVIRRTLGIMLERRFYGRFSRTVTIFGIHLGWEEMYLYLKHLFAFFFQRESPDQLKPHTIVLRETKIVTQKSFLPRTVQAATDRLKKALQELVGSSYDDLYADFSISGKVVIPLVGIQTIRDMNRSIL